jgi:hypothetical protein
LDQHLLSDLIIGLPKVDISQVGRHLRPPACDPAVAGVPTAAYIPAVAGVSGDAEWQK